MTDTVSMTHMTLTDKDKDRARLHRISTYGHDCTEYMYYDGGVARCSRCERTVGQLVRDAYRMSNSNENRGGPNQ